MIRSWLYILTAFVLVLGSRFVFASDAEQSDHHLPHNHIALFAGVAFEEQNDGHHEQGNIVGFEYVRQVHENWGWGVAAEIEVLGDENHRLGILVVPISYLPNDRWRLFGGPGLEFRDRGEPEHLVIRIGAGYEFELSEHFTLSPEAVIDFVEGGTTVYVLGFALGYGF